MMTLELKNDEKGTYKYGRKVYESVSKFLHLTGSIIRCRQTQKIRLQNLPFLLAPTSILKVESVPKCKHNLCYPKNLPFYSKCKYLLKDKNKLCEFNWLILKNEEHCTKWYVIYKILFPIILHSETVVETTQKELICLCHPYASNSLGLLWIFSSAGKCLTNSDPAKSKFISN